MTMLTNRAGLAIPACAEGRAHVKRAKKYTLVWDGLNSRMRETKDPDGVSFDEAKRRLSKYFRTSRDAHSLALRNVRRTKEADL